MRKLYGFDMGYFVKVPSKTGYNSVTIVMMKK